MGGWVVSFSLCPWSAAERRWGRVITGPSRLRPSLTLDPSSEEEVGSEQQMPFKPDSDVTAAVTVWFLWAENKGGEDLVGLGHGNHL